MGFQEGFFLGAATAAHQVEGNNVNSDSWAQEQMKYSGYAEPSMTAADHYNRYEEDIRMMAAANLNAYRFSIEWARIEPEKGKFKENEVEHYRKVIQCCRENGITPIVTMHHFTSPKWVIEAGGWESEDIVTYFRDYCVYIVKKLGKELEYVCTINEANMGVQLAAIARSYIQMMQGETESDKESEVQVGINLDELMAAQQKMAEENLKVFGTPTPQTFLSPRTPEGDILVMRAHIAARDAMKEVCGHLKVGVTLSLHDIQAVKGGEKNAEKEWDEEFLHYLPYIGKDDFLGVQNYTRTLLGKNGSLPVPEGAETTQMGYEFYPEALGNVVCRVAEEFKGEILVTENGIATGDDARRIEFISRALKGIRKCMDGGIPVKGYLHWSLLDNFEWQKGFSMTFGLVAVDRETQARHPKGSLYFLGSMR